MNFREKEKLLKHLEEKSYEEEFDEKELIMLSELSYDDSNYIRAVVARILVESNSEKGEQILLRLAKDHDTLVRTEACDSLCISEAAMTYDILKDIAEKDRIGLVRGYAIMSLGDIASRINMQDDLKSFLENKLINEKVLFTKISIYTVLYSLGQREYLTNLLLILNTKNYHNRCAVVNSLSEIINDDNKEVILTALLEQKKIETKWSVVSEINEVIDELESDRKESK